MPDLAASAERTLNGPVPRNGRQRAALRAIVAAAEDGKSFVAVTGEAGTGKTSVLAMAASLLDHPPIRIIRVDATGGAMSSLQLIERLAGPSDPDEPGAVLEAALERLLSPAPPRSRTILMIDDAHLLTQDALAYLELTSGLDEATGLQLVFAACPGFRLLHDSDLLRKLRERVSIRARLDAPAVTALPAEIPPRAVAAVPGAEPPPAAADHAIQPQPVQAATGAPRRRPRQYIITSALAGMAVLAGVGLAAHDRVRPPAALNATPGAAASRTRAPVPAPAIAARTARPAKAHPEPVRVTAPPTRPARQVGGPAVNLGGPLIALASSGSDDAMTALMDPPPMPAAAFPAGQAAPTLAQAASPPRQPPTPAPAQVKPPSAPSLSGEMIAALVSRGDDMLREGDIGAARLLYARAAEAGSGAAAIAMGKTFDPRFLADMGTQGIAPDPQTASAWYRRALGLGDRDAASLLARLSDVPAP